LARLGLRTVGALRQAPAHLLERAFGARGATRLLMLARGEDERPVTPDRAAKSISHEHTFARDITDRNTLRAALLAAVEETCYRLRRQRKLAGGVELKLRYDDFSTLTRSRKLPAPTDATAPIWRMVWRLFDQAWNGRPVRLLGVGATRLSPAQARQPELFASDAGALAPQNGLDAAADAVRQRFGAGALLRAAALQQPDKG
ncbi:MAG: DNA polymerase IV, partial [Planctomycetota bacterium]